MAFSSDTIFVYDGYEVVGDTEFLTSAQVGGNDTFYGDSYAYSYTAYGDAYAMGARARGGNDYFEGGSFVSDGGFFPDAVAEPGVGAQDFIGNGVEFVGDAGEMFGRARGGADTMDGGMNSNNEFLGDAWVMYEGAAGGNDIINGGDAYAYGEEFQTINALIGDGYEMGDVSKGGRDTITGGTVTAADYGDAYAVMVATGDGYAMYGYAAGAADTIQGANAEAYDGGDAYAINILAGDAYILAENSKGGNDVLVGGNAYGDGYDGQAVALNMMAGDALDAYGAIKVGNDTLTGGTGMNDGYALNIMYGDVGSSLFGNTSEALGAAVGDMLGAFTADVSVEVIDSYAAITYGNDKLYGGSEQALNFMVGDTEELNWGDVGGNDLLVAGDWDTENYLVGDAFYIEEGATGGNDRLVSGHSDDTMIGDAEDNYGVGGKDVFVFAMDNGNDVILDFEVGKDKLSLMVFGKSKYAFHVLSQDGRMEDTEAGVLLHLDLEDPASEYNTVLLVGVSAEELTVNSFM